MNDLRRGRQVGDVGERFLQEGDGGLVPVLTQHHAGLQRTAPQHAQPIAQFGVELAGLQAVLITDLRPRRGGGRRSCTLVERRLFEWITRDLEGQLHIAEGVGGDASALARAAAARSVTRACAATAAPSSPPGWAR